MSILQGLEPAAVFHYFEEICSIPHTSFHEKQLSDYCAEFARKKGLSFTQDAMGNLFIAADATHGYEDAEPVIIQGHLDMVGEKDLDCPLDLEKDGLQIYVNEDQIRAKGTTLGADNGIAVAYALALLDSENIPHPPLEIILTVSEEAGLIGASAMDLSSCKGRKFINLDSEEEGIFTVGCAGGRRAECNIPIRRVMKTGYYVNLSLTGLLGGHSGMEINKGRANANTLLGRFLLLLNEKIPYGLLELSGGTKENAIPKESSAALIISSKHSKIVEDTIAEFQDILRCEFASSDPDICFTGVVDTEEEETELVLDNFSLEKILTILNLTPNGVQAMCADLPGLVETSMNLGITNLENETFQMRVSIRSSVSSMKELLSMKLKHLVYMMDGTIEFSGDYPAWPYKKDSKLRDLCLQIYKEQYGKEPEIQLIHAGLECGIFSDKLPGLDCISFGPNLTDVHTTREALSISSVQRVWEYLKALLAAR